MGSNTDVSTGCGETHEMSIGASGVELTGKGKEEPTWVSEEMGCVGTGLGGGVWMVESIAEPLGDEPESGDERAISSSLQVRSMAISATPLLELRFFR